MSYNVIYLITKNIGTKTYTYTIKDELTNIRLDSDIYSQSDFKQYTYDKNGNINLFSVPDKDPTPQKITRTINPNKDQLLSQTNEDGSTYTFIYDAEGNLSKKTLTSSNETPSTTSYTYNYQGQLEKIVENNKVLATYQYNHKRQRVYSNTNSSALWGGEKYYYWDGFEHIIGEGSVEHGDHVVRYIYSGNEKIAMIRPKDLNDRSKGENIYWFINNAQGTPTKIVNESGDIVQYNNVDEWGNPSVPYAGNTAEINFTGKKYDAVTGLYYFNQRYYDPALGIFLSEDPAMQGLNPYAYCGNNPLGYVDPDGEFFIPMLMPIIKFAISQAFIITTTAAKGALEGAATNALFSVGFQWAGNGFNSSKINWNAVGQAAVGGAVSGALGSDGGIWQTGEHATRAQIVGVNIANEVTNGVTMALATGKNYHMTEFGRDLGMGGLRGLHYARQLKNTDLPETLEEANRAGGVEVAANYHRLRGAVGNVKRVFADGREAIYDSSKKLVKNALNGGTYNYINATTKMGAIGHTFVDVLPYWYFRNSMNDPSHIYERVTGYSIGY